MLAAADPRVGQPHHATVLACARRVPGELEGEPLLIHAGAAVDEEYRHWLTFFGVRWSHKAGAVAAWQRRLVAARSALVAVARVVDCRRLDWDEETIRTAVSAGLDDKTVDWLLAYEQEPWRGARRRWGWVLAEVRAFERPVGCRGSRGLWTPPPPALAEVRAQLPGDELRQQRLL